MKWLEFSERKQIEELYNNGEEINEIAEKLGRNRATIYKEIIKGSTDVMDNNGRAEYKADLAQRRHFEAKRKIGRRPAAVV